MSSLEDFQIQRMVEGPAYSIYVRENCIGVVAGSSQSSTSHSSTSQSSTGMMTEQGLAYLIWRDGQPYLAAKGGETPATPEQVETIRKFSQDLSTALNTATST